MTVVTWLPKYLPGISNLRGLLEGGQKWVFSATHSTDGEVVIKLIKPHTADERVRREILAVKEINSTRVPRIFEDGVLRGTPLGFDVIWLREQRILGENVKQILQRSTLSQKEILALCRHVLEALVDMGHARIVHRDIKPENIIRSADGSYWLIDFGIARHLDLSSLTATAALGGPGTLGYAPPEQYRNKKRDLDGRADLFALAVTLVECISGKHPYVDGARDAPMVLKRIEGAPLPIPKISWNRGRQFADFLTAMGQRRVDCRPRDASDALMWLQELQDTFAGSP
ncbi:serine/threonine-protein kinase [Nannocystis punicea]|uniref:Serine/threonine-protein kinase n=1 Tax=Nannocystis punicea TaxID=2995304 RepID=A0ABY7HJM1_9BACT|nr:serine/threonine-protein kinase [Nannocystis poenicansa]WAS99536.1 serine/threonine-protein kinase [Nannocystis poenicansa]